MKINGIGVGVNSTIYKVQDPNMRRVGGDVSGAFDDEVITALSKTQDLIGAVLRIHFCLEAFINIWCNKITDNTDFFDFGFIGFDKKAKIAKKLGLPENVYEILVMFNGIRNKYAHDTSAKITIKKLDEIRIKIDNLPSFGSKEMPKINDPKYETLIGDKMISWNGLDISIKDKLVFLYFNLSAKLISIYNNEFVKKNIPFSYFV